MRTFSSFIALVLLMCGCHSGGHGGSAGGPIPGLSAGTDQVTPLPGFVAAQVDANPNAPLTASGGTLAWTPAPVLSGVTVSVSRDSAWIQVPAAALTGAADVRVFALDGNVQISGTTTEHVKGADIFCAGDQQFNAPPPSSPMMMLPIDVYNLQGTTRLVVEVVGSLCPFTGPLASAHYDDTVTDTAELSGADVVPFSMYTESDIVSKYDSVIFNGHGAAAQLAAQAPPTDPQVLSRTTIVVTPQGYGVVPLSYFDDFSDNDQPTYIQDLPVVFSPQRCSNGQLYQNNRWSFYSYNYDHVDYHITRGQMNVTLADRFQDVFGSSFFMPRRPVAMGANDYLHVRYAANSDASQRRYWWIFVCGSDTAGQTVNSQGELTQAIVQTPFFYQSDGLNPSTAGWNCVQVFPRDGSPFPIGPTNPQVRAQSDVMVMVNQANGGTRTNMVDVSPNQYNTSGVLNSWYRQQDASGKLGAPILDDQMNIAPRGQYDLYISRSRVVMYVNGAQRLCNDFPGVPLTMAEGALGFGQVLYHSAAERIEFSDSFDVRTGQQYYLHNTPYLDVRSWDYAGYQEHTQLPASFNDADCYVYH